MTGSNVNGRTELDDAIRAREDEVADVRATFRMLDEGWGRYRELMRQDSAVFEEAGVAQGAKNYFVQKDLSARREVDGFVRRLADEVSESMGEMSRAFDAESGEELERLRRERAGTSWG